MKKKGRVPSLEVFAEVSSKVLQGLARVIPERFYFWIIQSKTPDIVATIFNMSPELMGKILARYKFEPVDIAMLKAEYLHKEIDSDEFPFGHLPEGATGKNYKGVYFERLFWLAKILKLKIQYKVPDLKSLAENKKTEGGYTYFWQKQLPCKLRTVDNMRYEEFANLCNKSDHKIASLEEVFNWMLDCAIHESINHNVKPEFTVFSGILGTFHFPEETPKASFTVITSTQCDESLKSNYAIFFDAYNDRIVLTTELQSAKRKNLGVIVSPKK